MQIKSTQDATKDKKMEKETEETPPKKGEKKNRKKKKLQAASLDGGLSRYGPGLDQNSLKTQSQTAGGDMLGRRRRGRFREEMPNWRDGGRAG